MVKLLSIGGSDASGGASIEADLKTFQEYGAFGVATLTAIVTMDPSRNWSHRVHSLEEDCVRDQLETAFAGVGVSAVKSGMLASVHAIECVAEYLERFAVAAYVFDPVMVCKGSGDALHRELNELMIQKLLPRATVVTPNLFETAQIAGISVPRTVDEMKEGARLIHERGASHVFVKGGGRLPGCKHALDVFYDGKTFHLVEDELVQSGWNHGAGCTVSAAITAGLGRGLTAYDAILSAKRFVTTGLRHGFQVNQWVGTGNLSKWRDRFH